WRATFLPYWLGLVTAVAVWIVLPRSRSRRDVRIPDQVKEAGGFLRSSRVLFSMGTGVVVFILIFGLFLTALPLHLEREFGLGATARGVMLGLPAITSTIAALSLGHLVARHGQRPLILFAMGLFGVAFVTIGVAPALPFLVAGALLYGLGEGLTIPSLQDVVAGAAPASSRGSVVAVWVGGVRAGQTAGPVMAGALVAGIGAPGTFVAGAGLAVALLVLLVLTGQPRTVDTPVAVVHDGRAGAPAG
ncbi:MAG: MFS transporter, partial [Acidimicrobiales bacterium]